MAAEPLRAIVVGAGHRAVVYAGYAKHHPEELRIVGVADPVPLRRQKLAEAYGIALEMCFETAADVAKAGRIADVIINGTMDRQHVPTTIPLLEAGYDVLLEKPFCTTEADMWALLETVRRTGRRVSICHVLRYAPFYAAIRAKLAAGTIGDVLSIQTTEHVSYHHLAVAFIRGKWANEAECGSPMLMSKCCHDLDLIVWMKTGVPPVAVSSFGGIYQFREDRAPKGAGTRCLVDCPIEADCLYSARKHYIDHPQRWRFYVWQCLEHVDNPTIEQKVASLRGDNPYGRCVWRCGSTVVDHQSLAIHFADGATGTHNMIGGTAKPSRSIHLIGTRGEIQGNLEESRFVIRSIDPRPGQEYGEEVVDLKVSGDMHGAFGGHGGGDLRLVRDFLRVVRGEPASLSTTSIEDSVYGHLLGFRAEVARRESRVVEVPGASASGQPARPVPQA